MPNPLYLPSVTKPLRARAIDCSNLRPRKDRQTPDQDVEAGRFISLTHASRTEDIPTPAPDGNKLVFVSDQVGNQEIYVMEAGYRPFR